MPQMKGVKATTENSYFHYLKTIITELPIFFIRELFFFILYSLFNDSLTFNPELPINAGTLLEAKLIKPSNDGVCLLAKGELTTKVNIYVAKASKSAITAVENAGGSVITPVPKPEQQGKGKARHKQTADREQNLTDSAVNKDA